MAERKFVVFQLADEWYGVPIERVERILEDQAVTRLPRLPQLYLGVFDLRGDTVPALDLRDRFGLGAREGQASMVIVQLETGRCAWRVDGVAGIFSLSEADIEESPALLRTKQDDFLAGVGKHKEKLIVLLEADHVVPESDRVKLALAA